MVAQHSSPPAPKKSSAGGAISFQPFHVAMMSDPKKSMKIVFAFLIASAAVSFAEIKPDQLVESAKNQIGVTVSYDPAYRKLDYPGGDVPQNTGVCSDVLIRALRDQKLDLQKEVHEDMGKDFGAYPRKWGLDKPDRNIDHRRVPNLMTYFRRKGYQMSISEKPQHYLTGDIVAWDLGGGVTHIGILSDKRTTAGVPLVIHNIGRGAREDEILFQFKIIGHYRLK